MKKEERDRLYKLFRDYEDAMGPSRTTLVALESMINSIKKLKCTDQAFGGLITELSDVIKETEPKIIPLIHLIEEFELEVAQHYGKKLPEAKAEAQAILEAKIARYRGNMEKVSEYGSTYVADGDFIIVHSPSTVVKLALMRAHWDLKKKFKVLILKQDFVKTRQFINEFAEAGMDHLVIPEYNLSQYLESANKLFIGAMSVTPDQKVVAAVGTANIVGLCHLNHIPVHLLINSLKFAHTDLQRQRIHVKEEIKEQENLTYRLTTFSHDRIDLSLIDRLITETGERSAA